MKEEHSHYLGFCGDDLPPIVIGQWCDCMADGSMACDAGREVMRCAVVEGTAGMWKSPGSNLHLDAVKLCAGTRERFG